MINQVTIKVQAPKRGMYKITKQIIANTVNIPETGLINLFLQHTSASLTLNENADPTVQSDMEKSFSKLVKENEDFYEHTCEGPDDMPAHIKSTIIGNSLTIPIKDGKLALGTWQGIYLFEHRDMCPIRKVILTIYA